MKKIFSGCFTVLLLTGFMAGCGHWDSASTGGGLADTTRPRVTITAPATTTPGPTLNAPTNSAIIAIFTENMAPATINSPATAFRVVNDNNGTPVAGTVGYAVGSRTATFTPTAALPDNTLFTATITTSATDLAGNQLAGNQAALPAASNYVWTFRTNGAAASGNVSVLSTTPADNAVGVCTNATINATFSVPSGLRMAPLTVTPGTFTVTGPASASVPAASVALDVATGRIATFTPQDNLTAGVTYTARITGGASGVTDLAIPGNTMLADNTWTFTPVVCGPASGGVSLGSAGTFGILATSATTSTGPTLINGDVGLRPGTSQGIPPTQVNGVIHVNDAAAAQAQTDLLTAYNFVKALAPGTTIATLGEQTLAPGTYTSAGTMLIDVGTTLTLDGGGDANAVWVFQLGSSLTANGNVSLQNGAQAKNIFWVPTAAATIGTGVTFNGTIMAGGNVTANTGATINGRILAGAIGAGTIALDSTTVNVPAL